MKEDPSTDAIVADPEMRSARQRPVARWKMPALAAALALALLAALYGWLRWSVPPAEPLPAPGTVTAPAAPAASAVADAPAPPAPAADAGPLPSLNESDLVFARWLEEALGREGLAQLRINDFARRFVVTVDNLGREQAPSRLWPVDPAAGRFETVTRDGRTVIAPDNALRYAPFVTLLESVDPARLASVYRNAYPLLQQAYEELGYPGKSFHGRLLAVIDHLLAAPQPAGEIEILPVQVRGPVSLNQSWRFLSFADPALEQLSAGQKLMLRVGPVNQRRLKQVLAGLKAALTAPPAAATAASR